MPFWDIDVTPDFWDDARKTLEETNMEDIIAVLRDAEFCIAYETAVDIEHAERVADIMVDSYSALDRDYLIDLILDMARESNTWDMRERRVYLTAHEDMGFIVNENEEKEA